MVPMATTTDIRRLHVTSCRYKVWIKLDQVCTPGKGSQERESVSFPGATSTKHHKLGERTQQKCLLHSAGGRKFKTKVSAGLTPKSLL
jgi:hypothetical protein